MGMFPGKPVHVLRNSAPEIPAKRKNRDTALTLCWTGAPWTRPKDLAVLQPLVKWIRNERVDVCWHHIGHAEGRLSFADAVGLPNKCVKTTELTGYNEYLGALSGDIGL